MPVMFAPSAMGGVTEVLFYINKDDNERKTGSEVRNEEEEERVFLKLRTIHRTVFPS